MSRNLSAIARRWTLILALLVFAVTAQAAPDPVPQDAVTSMSLVMPKKAVAKPKKARKLLVFSRCTGFYHDAIPFGIKALEMMGKQTGAFTTVVSDDISNFEPAKLKQFDAVCMNNSTGESFRPANFDKLSPAEQAAASKREKELQQSLIDFVKSGKGIIGIHAATDANYTWPEYGQMMGAYFDNHPWVWDMVEYAKVEEPNHRLCKPFKKTPSYKIADEIYQFRDPYSRQNLRVLLTLDTVKTEMKNAKMPVNRKDNDFAISWIRSYGKGRVFYCSLGHNHAIFWDPTLLKFYLGGIQFALGDLKADTTPSAKLAK